MNYPDHVTRYNHRQTLLLDAPRTYCHPRRKAAPEWMDVVVIALSVAVLISVGVMILQAV